MRGGRDEHPGPRGTIADRRRRTRAASLRAHGCRRRPPARRAWTRGLAGRRPGGGSRSTQRGQCHGTTVGVALVPGASRRRLQPDRRRNRRRRIGRRRTATARYAHEGRAPPAGGGAGSRGVGVRRGLRAALPDEDALTVAASGQPLTVTDDGRVRTITIDRPEARNALRTAMRRELVGLAESADADDAVAV